MAVLSGCTSLETVLIKKRCALHEQQMLLGPPEVSSLVGKVYGTTEYKLAAKEQFPYAGKTFDTRWEPPPFPEHFPRIKYCEQCRAAEAAWVRSKANIK